MLTAARRWPCARRRRTASWRRPSLRRRPGSPGWAAPAGTPCARSAYGTTRRSRQSRGGSPCSTRQGSSGSTLAPENTVKTQSRRSQMRRLQCEYGESTVTRYSESTV
eukprot:4598238-Pyramimonas_sp.AAC.2